MDQAYFESEMNKLAGKIDYKPDIIIGIVRGGMEPAKILSTKLKVNDIYFLSVKKINDDREVISEINEDLTNKKILLVEDMLETGKSLQKAKDYLKNKGAKVKTTCLYIMPQTEESPNYYLREVEEIPVFPWEAG